VGISLLSSMGLYWVLSKFYPFLGLTSLQTQIALLFITFNYTLIYFSNRIFRYSLFAFLFTSAFYCLVKGLTLYAGFLWGLTLLTCSFNGLRFFWVWLIFNPNPVTIILAGVMYLNFWIFPKIALYSNKKYHPSGTEGKFEIVNPFTFKQLLSPMYFPLNYAYYGSRLMKKSLKGWCGRIMGVWGLYPINLWVYPIWWIFLFFTIKGILLSDWKIVLVTILLLVPSLDIKYRPRNSVMVIPLIAYFLAQGVGIVPQNWVLWGLGGFLLGFLVLNRIPIVKRRSCLVGAVTSRILDHLPLDGVLCEGLIAYPIALLSKKRVVVMTHSPDYVQAKYETDLAIKEFKLNYAVFSDNWISQYWEGYPVIDYVKTFKLIKTIKESGDKYYIYEISIH